MTLGGNEEQFVWKCDILLAQATIIGILSQSKRKIDVYLYNWINYSTIVSLLDFVFQ